MRRLFLSMTLVLLLGCAQKIPPMPKVETSTPTVVKCSQGCQNDYTACMELDIRPDYLLLSPRKRACQKMLQECYQSCVDKEKKVPSAKDMQRKSNSRGSVSVQSGQIIYTKIGKQNREKSNICLKRYIRPVPKATANNAQPIKQVSI